VAEVFALLLRALGQEVGVVHSAAEALGQIEVFRPHVVFSDISMPGMTGYELARQLRHKHATNDAVLVAMTGFGQPGDRQRALDAGFDEHLVKPADMQQIREVLAKAAARLRR
jgi:CheY-like chemotaxis protein